MRISPTKLFADPSIAVVCRRFCLTPHQARVALLIDQPLENKEIAAKLGVSHKTVKFHLTEIYRRMKVKNRLEAMKLLQQEAF